MKFRFQSLFEFFRNYLINSCTFGVGLNLKFDESNKSFEEMTDRFEANFGKEKT